MNPYLAQKLTNQHVEELRPGAGVGRPYVAPRGPRNSVRHRARWTLVTIGLRLAATLDDG
jgi:hypothetical protein